MGKSERIVDLFEALHCDFAVPDPTDATPGVVYGRRTSWRSEHELWAAVLWQSARDVRLPRVRNRLRDELRSRACEWVRESDDTVGGFGWVCTLLGLEPSATGQRILRGDVFLPQQFGAIRILRRAESCASHRVSHRRAVMGRRASVWSGRNNWQPGRIRT
jgi:hypothetical protein